MANELMYAQFLDKAGEQTGTSVMDILAAEKYQEDLINAQNLANEGSTDFTPGEFDADEMLEDAGWEPGWTDVLMGAATKPMYAHMAQQGVDWTKNKLTKKTGQNLTGKLIQQGGKTALKTGGKVVTKLGSRLIPGIGWVAGIGDVLDFALPEGYGPWDLFGLAPNNAFAEWMGW